MEEKIKIKFNIGISCTSKIKKQKIYEFEFTQTQIDKAMKRSYEKPLFLGSAKSVMALYKDRNGELAFSYFTSYLGFDKVTLSGKQIKIAAKKV